MKVNDLRKYAGIAVKPEENDVVITESMDDMYQMHNFHNSLDSMIMSNMRMMEHGDDMAKAHAKKVDDVLVKLRDDCYKFSKKYEEMMKKDM